LKGDNNVATYSRKDETEDTSTVNNGAIAKNAELHEFAPEPVSILHELNLGQHTLFIMSNGGIDLLANDEHTPYLADHALTLDSDETYRLFVSLHEQYKQTTAQLC
jgi:hypothetical protein